jgi:hypothetical protein
LQAEVWTDPVIAAGQVWLGHSSPSPAALASLGEEVGEIQFRFNH